LGLAEVLGHRDEFLAAWADGEAARVAYRLELPPAQRLDLPAHHVRLHDFFATRVVREVVALVGAPSTGLREDVRIDASDGHVSSVEPPARCEGKPPHRWVAST